MLLCWRTPLTEAAASELRADWIWRGAGTSRLLWCCGDHERRAVMRAPPRAPPRPSSGLSVAAVVRRPPPPPPGLA